MRERYRLLMVVGCGLFAGAIGLRAADELGFVEDFALSDDRAEILKQLIPGTEDYYYYTCLYAQETGALDRVPGLIAEWVKKHNVTPRVREIENRQALLTYGKDPAASLEHIRDRLNLHFDHQKPRPDRKTNYPTALDPAWIAHDKLTQNALARHKDLAGFTDAALHGLVGSDLDPDRRRQLLQRLERPDYPELARLVVDNLNDRQSRGFGAFKIHGALLLEQLDECLKRKPDLLNNDAFVNVYLGKLQPSNDVDRQVNDAERAGFLERLWTFVSRLPPARNSLRAHVLYQRLALAREQGQYPRAMFMEYLKIPRQVAYINPRYVSQPELRNYRANLAEDFAEQTHCPPVGDDQPLVRDYLMYFLVEAKDSSEFAPYIDSDYLKAAFAETKIVNGIGNLDGWYALLTPDAYEALKERVDIDFLPTNPRRLRTADPVVLRVAIKNVSKLIVKVYEINTEAYYREHGEEITTSVDLDGLVPNHEQVKAYSQVALRRHEETLSFPELEGPGVYVVELIGNGKSSRALIRKGRLTAAERITAAGHVFTVYDEDARLVKDARLRLGGREFTPDADGELLVPFGSRSESEVAVLMRDGFAARHAFTHRAEEYAFDAGFHIDREALVAGEMCRVLIRPQLSINGVPSDLSLLEDVKLQIRSGDREDTVSSKSIPDFKLTGSREAEYSFKVPEKLRGLQLELSAKIRNVSRATDQPLSATASYQVNGIDATDRIEDVYLRHEADGYALEVRGKTGEPVPDRPVPLYLRHREFTEKVAVMLQTDAEGRIRLGALPGIESVELRDTPPPVRRWDLVRDAHSHPGEIHAVAGEVVTVPVMTAAGATALRDTASLLETRGGTFVRDALNHATLRDGFLVIDGLPAGDYDLLLRAEDMRIPIRVTAGRRERDVLLSDARYLDPRGRGALQITAVTADAKAGVLTVRLANVTPAARVHIVASRFVPEQTLSAALGEPLLPPPVEGHLAPRLSQYLSGRNIGDEYRYILERKYARKFPGNMLERPRLLLNPWSIGKTETGREQAKTGEAWQAVAERPAEEMMKRQAMSRAGGRWAAAHEVPGIEGFTSYDFLPSPALLLANLEPDGNGVVRVALAELGARRELQVMALDDNDAAYRELALPREPETYRDLRLVHGFDPARHLIEQKAVSAVGGGEPFVVEDITTSKLEIYDSPAAVYRLFMALSADAELAEFGFITTWPSLEPARKRELYSKYACHELNFFLSCRDPAFFETVVQPYLRAKRDKTFMDRLLLGDDLSAYDDPWAYGRLNIVEQILLTRVRDAAARTATARHVSDRWELIPRDVEGWDHLFRTALKGSALEEEGGVDGFAAAATEALAEADGKAHFALGSIAGELAEKRATKVAPAPADPAALPPPVLAGKPASNLAREARKKSDLGLAELKELQADRAVAPEALYFDASSVDAKREDVAKLASRRRSLRRFYTPLDTTEEWVENNYYHVPLARCNAELVTVNAFWRDYAAADPAKPFYSPNVAEASRNFTEMMFALAVLDLPFAPAKCEPAYDGARMTLTPPSPVLVYHKQARQAPEPKQAAPVLVSQNVFARDDRYRFEGNERYDKFVTEEFQTRRVYGCQVVLTNPTSSRRKVELLLQIPRGALPVANGFYTKSLPIAVEPYATASTEYYFYFPAAGAFPHYPVHVAQDGVLIASVKPIPFNVVDELTRVDETSWPYIAGNGDATAVLAYLDGHNLDRLDLGLIAFRMQDAGFFRETLERLRRRRVYNDVLWSYGLRHNDPAAIREYLCHSRYAEQCGPCIESELLTLDPVARQAYEHKEYRPLVNARTYRLGKTRTILNRQFRAQYLAFLNVLAYHPKLDAADRLGAVYYLLLQDRVEEALAQFAKLDAAAHAGNVAYDYARAYLAWYREDAAEAARIAEAYRDYPVDRWRDLFRDVLAQAAEVRGGAAAAVVDADDRAQAQTQLADTAPHLELEVKDGAIHLRHRNLSSCRVNVYMMDLELLFSRNPFVQEVSGQFAVIRPNAAFDVGLDAAAAAAAKVVPLPAGCRDRDVMIEVQGGGLTRSQAYYPNTLAVELTETYGNLRVTDRESNTPMPRVYIKVYARMTDGDVRFYKDGYTDLRGRFDYTSLSTDELKNVERFALLILSETRGAVVREAAPPK